MSIVLFPPCKTSKLSHLGNQNKINQEITELKDMSQIMEEEKTTTRIQKKICQCTSGLFIVTNGKTD